jgi:outer membrane protein
MDSYKTAVGPSDCSTGARSREASLLLKGAALAGLLAMLSGGAGAQTAPPPGPPLAAETAAVPNRAAAGVIDEYVREALHSNLSLHAESMAVEREFAALDQARAQLLPTLALDASYTSASGGRTLELPLGTLMNPVYGTLNQLLAAQGRHAQFAPIQNQTVYFQRQQEQVTRLSLRQPLYAPAIPAAVRAQRAQLEAEQFNRAALARRLKRDVTVGYLDWLKATHAVRIVGASVELLLENVRVSDSLYRNGKVTQDQVLRARAELLAVEQQLRDARNNETQLRSYVNFLLNRPLDTALEPATIDKELARNGHDLALLRAQALGNRPELAQLDRSVSAAQSQVGVASAARKPTLSLGADAGIDDVHYDFGTGSNFSTISLLLRWQFFDGGATRAAEDSARAEARRTALEREAMAQQVQLEVEQALDALETSRDSLATAEARADAAHAAFRIASRKRDEGVINQVEFIDSRSTLTGAELNLNVTRFEVLARQAELDYATAAGTLPLDALTPGTP